MSSTSAPFAKGVGNISPFLVLINARKMIFVLVAESLWCKVKNNKMNFARFCNPFKNSINVKVLLGTGVAIIYATTLQDDSFFNGYVGCLFAPNYITRKSIERNHNITFRYVLYHHYRSVFDQEPLFLEAINRRNTVALAELTDRFSGIVATDKIMQALRDLSNNNEIEKLIKKQILLNLWQTSSSPGIEILRMIIGVNLTPNVERIKVRLDIVALSFFQKLVDKNELNLLEYLLKNKVVNNEIKTAIKDGSLLTRAFQLERYEMCKLLISYGADTKPITSTYKRRHLYNKGVKVMLETTKQVFFLE